MNIRNCRNNWYQVLMCMANDNIENENQNLTFKEPVKWPLRTLKDKNKQHPDEG